MKLNVPASTLILLAIGAVLGVQGAVIEHASLGLLTWEVSDLSIATVKFDADGKAYLVPTGKAGTVIVRVKGDQNPDTPQIFTGELEVTFAEGEAMAVEIVGTIVDPATVALVAEADPVDPVVTESAPVDPALTETSEKTEQPA